MDKVYQIEGLSDEVRAFVEDSVYPLDRSILKYHGLARAQREREATLSRLEKAVNKGRAELQKSATMYSTIYCFCLYHGIE